MSAKRRRRSSVQSQFNPSVKGVLLLFLFVALLVAGGVLLPRLSQKSKQTDPVAPSIIAALAAVGTIHVNLPDIDFPVAEAPAEAPIQLFFTEDEVNNINQMLEAWAAEETFIRVVPDKEKNSVSGSDSSTSSSSSQDASQIQEGGQTQYKPDGGHDVAVWFLDIQSGAQYVYNDQTPLYYASMMKAPYAAWLYSLAQDGQCDLEQLLEVKPDDIGKYKDNTGKLKSMELPAELSVETLIGLMLEHSDTVALKKLLTLYPAQDFRQWAAEQGVQNPDALKSVVSGKATAADMGMLTAAVYRVMEQGQYGPDLRRHMENSGNRMIVSDHAVAHKYGWDEHAYHDMAVVYAPHPYLLVIMTDKWGGSSGERAQFGTISRTLEAMMAEKWAEQGAQV